MPKRPSEDLFELIRTMTKAEKRHFRIFASAQERGSQNAYITLFRLIDAQEKYDEKKILKKIPKITPAQFSNRKKYLYDLLLESLRNLHAGESIDSRIRNMLQETELLFNRRLLRQSLRLLQKARKLAADNERMYLLTDILHWEERLLNETFATVQKTDLEVDRILEDSETAAAAVQAMVAYRVLLLRMLRLFRSGGVLYQKNNRESLEKIFRSPLMKRNPDTLSFHEKYYHFTVCGMYYMILNDWPACYEYRLKTLRHFENHPEQMDILPHVYASALNSFIIACEYTAHERELAYAFGKVIEKLHDTANGPATRIRLMSCCASVLHYYIHRGEFGHGVQLIGEIEEAVQALRNDMPKSTEISFCYTFSYAYFGNGNYRKALHWLNQVLNEKSELREDIRIFAHLFNLIIHYELGHEDSFEYFVKSTYRYLAGKKQLFRLEQAMIDFIRKKMPQMHTPAETKKAFAGLKTVLEQLVTDPHERRTTEYFDFISWLTGKIEGRAFGDVVKEKYRKGKETV
ncbi:MAG: hypothetical protein FD123_3071 [Bacteroidetes bacterium]|nr:MAG: hypothetical protein FD123_3071 [Bacteroidota bacterium]